MLMCLHAILTGINIEIKIVPGYYFRLIFQAISVWNDGKILIYNNLKPK